MGDIKDEERSAFHGSYQQLEDAIDEIYREVIKLERGDTPDKTRVENVLGEMPRLMEIWSAAVVTRLHQ